MENPAPRASAVVRDRSDNATSDSLQNRWAPTPAQRRYRDRIAEYESNLTAGWGPSARETVPTGPEVRGRLDRGTLYPFGFGRAEAAIRASFPPTPHGRWLQRQDVAVRLLGTLAAVQVAWNPRQHTPGWRMKHADLGPVLRSSVATARRALGLLIDGGWIEPRAWTPKVTRWVEGDNGKRVRETRQWEHERTYHLTDRAKELVLGVVAKNPMVSRPAQGEQPQIIPVRDQSPKSKSDAASRRHSPEAPEGRGAANPGTVPGASPLPCGAPRVDPWGADIAAIAARHGASARALEVIRTPGAPTPPRWGWEVIPDRPK